ncbi:MAG: tRNA lysidine(34) synthetase TilS [Bacteroidia bacterium]|nr:tRNA lysidine(34) synthetase TilS [Bacteroidia bacterium]
MNRDKFEVRFVNYLRRQKLVSVTDKILLAVSGGIDSMVMVNLFKESRIEFAIAHCNFSLRQKDSDRDEEFVRRESKYLGVPFFCKKFKTEEIALKNKLSIQVTARELRYKFFTDLCRRHGYSSCATAHHTDDSIETFFINLLRGTGLMGERGIPVKQGIFFRPLLFATRKEVESYAVSHEIRWREDTSNRSDFYLRNRIRHQLIPVLEDLNPSFQHVLQRHIENVEGSSILFNEYLEQLRLNYVKFYKDLILIEKDVLLKHPAGFTLTFEFLRNYGFNRDTCSDIYLALDKTPGKRFLSTNYELITDRQYIMVKSLKTKTTNEYKIEEDWHHFEWEGGILALRKIVLTHDFKEKIISGEYTDPNVVWVDASKLKFPLLLRKWKKGDEFHPIGMKGKKKLSDLFTDIKLSAAKKEHTWVIESGERIVWVVGIRQDNYFRITEETTVSYQLVLESE